MDTTVISVVLLPSVADSKRLIECSAAINAQTPSLIQLSAACLPHITIAQFIAPPEEAINLWKQVSDWASDVTEITAAGLHFHVNSKEKNLSIDVNFVKSRAIADLQNKVCQTAFANSFTICNPTGDSFRPHCTLALFPGHTIPALQLNDLELFNRVYEDLTLVVGINGKNWTFTESKYPA